MYQYIGLIIINYNKKDCKFVLGVKFSYLKFISQVWKYVYDTLNVLFTSNLDSRLMVFNKINNCFTLFINLEMWQPLVHYLKKFPFFYI
jgi:hypothetical protein